MRLWDPKMGTSLGTLGGYGGIGAWAISPDGMMFVSADDEIQLWDVRSGRVVRTLEGHTSEVTHLVLSADGRTLASTQRWDESIWIWDVATGQHLRTVASHVDGLALSPDGQMVTSGYEIYDVQTGEMRHDLRKGLIGERYGAVFSPDGTKLASALKLSRMTGKTAVTLWEAETGELLRTLEAPASLSIFGAIAFSPDGKRVGAGGSGARVWLWDVETGELLRTLEGYPAEMMSVAFSPDGALVAAGVRDRVTPSGTPEPTMRLWGVRTGRLLPALEGYTADVYHLSFSPDGTMLVSGASDGTVRLWGVPPAD